MPFWAAALAVLPLNIRLEFRYPGVDIIILPTNFTSNYFPYKKITSVPRIRFLARSRLGGTRPIA